jgi:hypothetical protein
MRKRALGFLGLSGIGVGLVALAGACVSSNKSPAPAVVVEDAGAPPPGASSGALGVVVIDGTQKLYLPTTKINAAGNNVVSVVNVGLAGSGVAGTPALIKDIDLGVSDDHPVLAAGDPTMILVGSGLTRNIWIIDPTTDTLVKTIQLDPSTQTTAFSTPDGYMNGIAIDSVRRKAYISVWNGFAVFDMNTMTITSTILSDPAENFALDTTNEKLYAPFYNCTGQGATPPTCATTLDGDDAGTAMVAGLDVIDLTSGTVYTYRDLSNPNPSSPFGSSPDSAGIDPTTQLLFIPDEFGQQYALDFSKAVFDKATNSVTAPHEMMANQSFEGVAVEPTKHFGFWEHEYANNIGVLNLAGFAITGDVDASDDGTEAVAGFVASTMPDTPALHGTVAADSTSWSNSGDPHGMAVATGIANGKPVAFLVDYPNNDWIARIDLEAMSTIVGATPGMLTPAEVSPAITYLDALTAVGAAGP